MMNNILIQHPLTEHELEQLKKEFSQFHLILIKDEKDLNTIDNKTWNKIEVIYSNILSKTTLAKATQLRWIHSPTSYMHQLCLTEIQERSSIYVTITKGLNVVQMAEFAMAGILSFSKHLITWNEANKNIEKIWSLEERKTMWTLNNKTLLLVGLGHLGTEIARLSKEFGVYIIGIDAKRRFHPYCDKILGSESLNSVLPHADILCLTLPHGEKHLCFLGEKEFKLLKQDSIFITLGSHNAIDDRSLEHFAKERKFRGVLVDSNKNLALPKDSPLWQNPHVIVTPDVAQSPQSPSKETFRLFRYNLRQFVHGNFVEMKNIITF